MVAAVSRGLREGEGVGNGNGTEVCFSERLFLIDLSHLPTGLEGKVPGVRFGT